MIVRNYQHVVSLIDDRNRLSWAKAFGFVRGFAQRLRWICVEHDHHPIVLVLIKEIGRDSGAVAGAGAARSVRLDPHVSQLTGNENSP
jgi:hypothetical protein